MRWRTPRGGWPRALRSRAAASPLGAGVRQVKRMMPRGGDGSRSEQRVTPGVVERITRKVVKGWVSVPADAPPTRVTLNLDNLGIVSTYASPETPGAVGRRGSRSSRSTAAASSQRPAPGRRQNLPGPGEDHRNTG